MTGSVKQIQPTVAAVQWVAVDWGTTHVRAYAMAHDGTVLAETQSAEGMSTLSPTAFEPVLLGLIADWLAAAVSLPLSVLACGMVGAKQGWREAPYQQVPCAPLSRQPLRAIAHTDPRIRVFILPGVSQAEPADVMRGEETQLAGLLQHLAHPKADSPLTAAKTKPTEHAVTACLPGTHSKWVKLRNGQLTHFATFMTGEWFALLCQHSVLKHSVATTAWDNSAFISGVQQGIAEPAQLLSSVFRLRAQGLLNGLAAQTARAQLSGLLLGSELAGTSHYWQGQTVHLIGSGPLATLYARALRAVRTESGTQTVVHAPETMTLAGLRQAYHYLGTA